VAPYGRPLTFRIGSTADNHLACVISGSRIHAAPARLDHPAKR
jgi:hypothetical protein